MHNKKYTINPHNNDNRCFQYSVVLSLYQRHIKHHPERISTIKPFIDNFSWKTINVPPQEQDYKTFEMNNKSIALSVLIALNNEDNKKIR